MSPHLASLALAALASALAAAVAVASAQPTSIGGLIQQIPVVGTQIKPCPPVGFDSLPNFNLTAYVSAPWYIQQQIPLVYQPVNQLYCVRAVYKPRDPANFKKGTVVYNSANEGSVTGKQVGTVPNTNATSTGNPFGGQTGIVAYPEPYPKNATTAASKLRVLPTFFEGLYQLKPAIPGISGPYWIVATSGDTTAPDAWSVISGGPPTTPSNGACRTGREGPQTFLDVNGSGFWIFTRQPVPSAAVVEAARTAAKAIGFDLTPLVNVEQAGCTYPAIPA